jgi:dTDP-4-dehydrorhamnose 3,5-epimerase
MILEPVPLAGAWIIRPEPSHDARGFFARTWSAREMQALQLDIRVAQCSVSFNRERGTLRGMHFQRAPHGEAKVVRCTRGAVFDVIVDLRPDSPTRHAWYGMELSADNRLGLYIPDGMAHGFLTREDHTELTYQISTEYEPSAAAGVRWDDPAFNIAWPGEVRVISDRDRAFPLIGSHS